MAPFIRFTEKSGDRDLREILINAEHIVTATYLQQSGDLQITLIDRGDRVTHTLHGQEAADAVESLRSLRR
jgi:hypothetical protein